MDHLIDDAAQEILLHLPLKHLIRFRVVSRRYNAMILSPGFIARHGQLHSPCASGGVFLHHARRDQLEPSPGGGGRGTPVGESSYACFVAASSTTSPPAAPAFHDIDLAGFLPMPSARETAYLQRTTGAADARSDDVFIVHSSAGHGLLLCCRGRVSPVHYYVSDPVARRLARLPELPRPPANEQSGLLSVAADEDTAIKQFQVILFDQRRQWDVPGGSLDLEVFSSSSGDWTPLRVPYPADFTSFQCSRPPLLAPSGAAAYWLGFWRSQAVAYSSVDVVLLEASQVGRLAAYSMKQRKLSFRCQLSPGVTFAPVDMFPYVRPPHGAVEVPGMQGLDA